MNQLKLKNIMSIVDKLSKENAKTAQVQSPEFPAYPDIIGSWGDSTEEIKTAEVEETIQEEEDTQTTKQDPLQPLAVHLRAMQFLYHNFHHLVSGASFFSDHKFFGSSYSDIESNYDSVVENIIGFGSTIDLNTLQYDAVKKMVDLSSGEDFFGSALIAENELQSLIEDISKEQLYQGTTNLIGAIAEISKSRIYKIKQRIA
jgi:DNA-binding ferritin-like protein